MRKQDQSTRRRFLGLAGSAAVLGSVPAVTLRPAEATPATLASAIRNVVGGAVVRTGKVKLDLPPLVIPAKAKKYGAVRIYDAPAGGAQIYHEPRPVQLTSLSNQIDLPFSTPELQPSMAVDLTIPSNPS